MGFTAGIVVGKTLLRINAIDTALGAADIALTDLWLGDSADDGVQVPDIVVGDAFDLETDDGTGWV